MKLLRILHAAHAILVFAVLFVLFFPLLLVPIVWKRWYGLVGVFNRWWARLFFTLSLFPHRVELRSELDKKKQYIFCANHFSYLDIPAMGLNPVNAIFVGKNDMEKIPLFGFMYRKLHITVNRQSIRSRYTTVLRSLEAIDEGKSLVIFPEGGIVSDTPPQMARFKDGAFRMAIEKQIPIIPVTIPYNWIILPDSSYLPRHRSLKVIFHEPILTEGVTLEDIEVLKGRTYEIIDAELKRHNHEN